MAEYFFSIVIPTYNRKELLSKCLESLIRQSFQSAQFEVIVVDDGSTDGTGAMFQNMTFSFRFIALRIEHGGPSKARNAGIHIASGTYVTFLEDDVVADKYFLENAFHHLKSSDVDMLEGRTTYQMSKKNVRRLEDENQLSFIPCNLFVKRTIFEKVGGYDPEFYDLNSHLYFREDADLGFRILDAGFRAKKANDVIVEHPEQFADLTACFRHVRRYIFDPLLYKKHPKRFGQMIEVKNIFGLVVHRPQHYLALIYIVALVWFSTELFFGTGSHAIILAPIAVMCPLLYRYKYQRWRAIKIYQLYTTIGFFIIPLVYMYSVVRGCFRFKTLGVLL